MTVQCSLQQTNKIYSMIYGYLSGSVQQPYAHEFTVSCRATLCCPKYQLSALILFVCNQLLSHMFHSCGRSKIKYCVVFHQLYITLEYAVLENNFMTGNMAGNGLFVATSLAYQRCLLKDSFVVVKIDESFPFCQQVIIPDLQVLEA